MLLLGRTTTLRSMMTNFACMTPKGFLNRLNTVRSRESSVFGSGKPSFLHVFEFHFRTPFKRRNFCANEYEENKMRTVIRRPICFPRSFSVTRASCKFDSDGDGAQKQVEKRTSSWACMRRSVRYRVVTNPLPITNSMTRPEACISSILPFFPIVATASSNIGFAVSRAGVGM